MNWYCSECHSQIVKVAPNLRNGYRDWQHIMEKWDESHEAKPEIRTYLTETGATIEERINPDGSFTQIGLSRKHLCPNCGILVPANQPCHNRKTT